MNITIFSKDRACQLELLLRSMKKYFKECNQFRISILYTYSNENFRRGYELTKQKHPEFNYIKEESFKNNLLSVIDENKKYTTFFVDDNIFKEPFSIEDNEFKLLENDSVVCLSLRLHPNLTYCYPAKIQQRKPELIDECILPWVGKEGDFGYPMSVDGHIVRTSDIIDMLRLNGYSNPNSLEGGLAANPIRKPFMVMYQKSIIMNNPVNKVQNFNNNVFGDVSQEFINEQYLDGKIISMSNIDGFENISCHQEIEVIFE